MLTVNIMLRMYTLLREIMARPSYSRANNRLDRSHEKYRSTSHRFGCGMVTVHGLLGSA